MGKCFVTKLTSEVSNPNLPYLEELIYSGKLNPLTVGQSTSEQFRSEIIAPCKEGDRFRIKVKCDLNIQPSVGGKLYLKDDSGVASTLADYDIETFEKFDDWNDCLVTATKTTADSSNLRVTVYFPSSISSDRTFDCECYKVSN